MRFSPGSFGTLREANSCHTPAGTPAGGQFCSKTDATGPYPERDDKPGWERYFTSEKDWKQRMTHAVSLGKIDPKDAKLLGWHADSNAQKGYEPLPPVLYHVSTAYNPILLQGLKTRDEIGGVHRGLGGGTDDTISFTDDLSTARAIRSAILEARRVVRGELTPRQMVRMLKAMPSSDVIAKNKAQTSRAKYMQSQGPVSAWEIFVSFYAGKQWNVGDPLPVNLKRALNEVKQIELSPHSDDPVIAQAAQARKGKGLGFPVTAIPKGYTPDGGWKGRDERFASRVIRKMTPAERRDSAFEMYKKFANARENGGGRMDPLFFLTDAEALSKVKVKDIKIIRFKPRRGARGYQVSSLGEWRVHTGKAVKYDGIAESAAAHAIIRV